MLLRSCSAERDDRGTVAQLVQALQLPLGAALERREGGRVEARFGDRERREGTPEAELAADPGHEALELEHATERRVAAQLPVRLQAAGLLHAPRQRRLDGVGTHAKALHEAFERRAVLRDLGRDLLERPAELRAAVGVRGPAGELMTARRGGEGVVEVDGEEP